MAFPNLFSYLQLGSIELPNRIMNLGVARIGVTATEAVTLDSRARRNGDGPVHHAPVDAGGL